MNAAIYARVSTIDQHCAMQLTDLRAHCERNGWPTVEYVENASGKAGSRRPVLKQLLKDAQARKFDTALVWKMDRFGRSTIDVITNIQELERAGVRFVVPSQGIDTDQRNPFAKAMMHLMAVFAELERDIIAERVNAGVQEYRRSYAAGKVGAGKPRRSKSGKDLPHGRPQKIFARDKAHELFATGMSRRAIAKQLKVSEATIRRTLKAAA
jgi:putative DNA-invertase from lambdoid prophage Rac